MPRVGPGRVEEVGSEGSEEGSECRSRVQSPECRASAQAAPERDLLGLCSVICGLFAPPGGLVVFGFPLFILDRFVRAAKRSSELPLPRTLNAGADYTNKC